MKLYEFEGKKILKEHSIPVPRGGVYEEYSIDRESYLSNIPVVLKAQVLTGGRGKAGGIKLVDTEDEVRSSFEHILKLKIKGLQVKKILIEEKLDVKHELYLGYSILRSEAKIVFMISKEGGMDIEDLARTNPEAIIKFPINIIDGFDKDTIGDLVGKLGFANEITLQITNIAEILYGIFTDYECDVAEINPLVITDDDKLIAADARISIYDEAIYKHPEYQKEEDTYTTLETKARRINLGYVEMDGNIGVTGNGAGLNMATLDIITYFGGKPANFLEVSGRTYHKAKEAIEIILSNPNVKIIFGNFFGCISRCDVIAEGLAAAIKDGILNVPLVIAMRGTGSEEGLKTLKNAGVEELYEDDIDAGKRVIEILKKL
ncbi:MAG: ADP-forming succinate--CoA ligase subunit beta [Elusimicrobia bacterium HGW-Elusimicrobia-2]|nr:MAG: ADP-forming succinate--CoA ligase subunit beta [Elusimicrobia bacterium HGW-Elusimicrobia-2]